MIEINITKIAQDIKRVLSGVKLQEDGSVGLVVVTLECTEAFK